MSSHEFPAPRQIEPRPDYTDFDDVSRYLRERIMKLYSILLQGNLQEIQDVVSEVRRTIMIIRAHHQPSENAEEYLFLAEEELSYVADPSSASEAALDESGDTDRRTVWSYEHLTGAEYAIASALSLMDPANQ